MNTRPHDPFSPHAHRPWAADAATAIAAATRVTTPDAGQPVDEGAADAPVVEQVPIAPQSAGDGPAGPDTPADPFEDDDARLRAALAALDAAQGSR